jgi:DNA invertase Pin-like site-specific DNA recombinase
MSPKEAAMRDFLYCRVSTSDLTTDNQVSDANKSGYEIEDQRIITETISGGTIARERPEFKRLLDKLERGDRLIVTKLDRLGRDNIDIQQTVKHLVDLGVVVRILDMPEEIDSSTGMLVLQIFASFAEFERARISERTKIGLERAKAQGKALGRPVATQTGKDVRLHQGKGMTQKEVASVLAISVRTVQRHWVRERQQCLSIG